MSTHLHLLINTLVREDGKQLSCVFRTRGHTELYFNYTVVILTIVDPTTRDLRWSPVVQKGGYDGSLYYFVSG